MYDLRWVSFIQPTEDHRPLSFPPNKKILGWWCTGYDGHDRAILCALINAKDCINAGMIIRQDFPEAILWRFCEEKKTTALSSRFKIEDWMLDHLKLYVDGVDWEKRYNDLAENKSDALKNWQRLI